MRAVQTGSAVGLVRGLVMPSGLLGTVACRSGWPRASVSAPLPPCAVDAASVAVASGVVQGQDG
jgi:hypothetical protein